MEPDFQGDGDWQGKELLLYSIGPIFCFNRYPKGNVPPETIRNAPLLCPHEKFLFNPECDVEDNGASEE